jgi:hypothetical protein
MVTVLVSAKRDKAPHQRKHKRKILYLHLKPPANCTTPQKSTAINTLLD